MRMPNVQIRDASDTDKILVNTTHLPFELREQTPVWFFTRTGDRKPRGFLITGILQYQIIETSPQESGIVYMARPLDD